MPMAMAFSLKLALVSATVFSTALIFKPLVMDFPISDLPAIWTSLVSWLKPPYLYVVINCIIITILASSRLQSKADDSPSLSTLVLLPTEPVKVARPVDVPLIHEPDVHEFLLVNEGAKDAAAGYNTSAKYVQVLEPELSVLRFTDDFRDEDIKAATVAYEEIAKDSVNISLVSTTPSKTNQVDFSFPMERPAASARFIHRKPAKATPEGGRTLGVAKPKRQETLESTWKTITEGRSVPLTRHLRKSDTWETHGHDVKSESEELLDHHHSERMTKSDTLDVNRGGGSRRPPPPPSKLNRSSGSGRLKKEPSLGQEELNRRVEAFIKKFNEDMRLQRQESLNQYMEMINRGAH